MVIFVFLFSFYPDILLTLNIYPEDTLTDAIKTYRDDEGKQELIDTIQKRVSDFSPK